MAKKAAAAKDPIGIDGVRFEGSGSLSAFDAKFEAYVNVDLDEHQKQQWAQFAEEDAVWEVYEGHIRLGLNYSVKWMPEEACYMAKVFCRDANHVSRGLTLTVRANSAIKATTRAVFIVDHILGTDWRAAAVQKKRNDW